MSLVAEVVRGLLGALVAWGQQLDAGSVAGGACGQLLVAATELSRCVVDALCVHVCVNVCVFVLTLRVHMCTCVSFILLCVIVYTHISIYMCVCVYMCVYIIYVIHVCICICVYAYVCCSLHAM